MNKARRKQLDTLLEQFESLKSELETIASEERDSYDNMPESLQQGERGQASEAAADKMDEAVSSLEDVYSAIEEAKE
jgi:hypothetical protein